MAASRKPGKQRRRMYNSPLHLRRRLMSAHLAPKYLEDAKVHYPRSLPLRVGDTVRIMRGRERGKEAKVTKIDHRRLRVIVEGVTVAKADKSQKPYPIHPSNVMITRIDLSDKWRRKILERAGAKVEEGEG